jgi:hypothetical protein
MREAAENKAARCTVVNYMANEVIDDYLMLAALMMTLAVVGSIGREILIYIFCGRFCPSFHHLEAQAATATAVLLRSTKYQQQRGHIRRFWRV